MSYIGVAGPARSYDRAAGSGADLIAYRGWGDGDGGGDVITVCDNLFSM